MCPPDFFQIRHKINAWMDKKHQPIVSLARVQWQQILKAYVDAGLEIWFINPDSDCQDMCFSANAAWCRWGKVLLANFRGQNGMVARARQGEIEHYIKWFESHRQTHPDLDIIPFPQTSIAFEGQGDVVTINPDGTKDDAIVLVGFGQNRTAFLASSVIKDVHGLRRHQVIPMRLTNSFFYHLDTACVFVPPNLFLFYPNAFDKKGLKAIHELPVDLIEVSEVDAKSFACNGVFVKRDSSIFFITNKISANLTSKLKERGISVINTDTGEFIKSGGSVRCLTLFLPQDICE